MQRLYRPIREDLKPIKIERPEDIIGTRWAREIKRIPGRKERYELFKTNKKSLDPIDSARLKELEGLADKRLKEKTLITGLAIIWILISMLGKTPYCAMWGVPFALITLIAGLWLV